MIKSHACVKAFAALFQDLSYLLAGENEAQSLLPVLFGHGLHIESSFQCNMTKAMDRQAHGMSSSCIVGCLQRQLTEPAYKGCLQAVHMYVNSPVTPLCKPEAYTCCVTGV